jgi:hypothetical protein
MLFLTTEPADLTLATERYVSDEVYYRLVQELAALPFQPNERQGDSAETWAVNFLTLVCDVEPESLRDMHDREAGHQEAMTSDPVER